MADSLMDPWNSLITAYAPPSDTRRSSEPTGTIDANWVIDGLVKRGLPAHIAEGFAMNMDDESRFDPGINEISPLVKGSRGGFGLYQLTGPRRRAYESYAKRQGVEFGDPDAQLDFLMMELQGSEKAAANAIMQTRTAGEAGAAIVNKFLRPAAKHRKHRADKYLGTAYTPSSPSTDFSKLWLSLGEENG